MEKGFRFQGEFLLNASRIQIFVAIKLNCGFTFYLIWNKCGDRERFTNQRSVGNCRGQENGSPINKRRGPLCGSTQKTVWFQDGQKEALFKFLKEHLDHERRFKTYLILMLGGATSKFWSIQSSRIGKSLFYFIKLSHSQDQKCKVRLALCS